LPLTEKFTVSGKPISSSSGGDRVLPRKREKKGIRKFGERLPQVKLKKKLVGERI